MAATAAAATRKRAKPEANGKPEEGKPSKPAKKRFTMSEEHKAKLAAGREKAAREKEAAIAAAERGEIPAPDFTSIGSKPRSLPDIFLHYPIGDGKHFIQVVRTHPKRYYEQNVAGVQIPIRQSMTEEEFGSFYGGAEYELRVYAQDERPDGTPFSKPLTDPIVYRIPGPPNLESAITEDDDMRNYGHPRRSLERPDRVFTPAEAQVHIRHIDQRDKDAERELRLDAERRASEEARASEEREREMSVVDRVERRTEREIERMEAAKARELELAREAEGAKARERLARQEKPAVDPLDLLLRSKELFASKDDGASQAHMQQLIEAHKHEVGRMHADHEKQLKAERDRADSRIKDADERADSRIKDERERCERRIREVEETSNRRISDVEQRKLQEVSEAQRRGDERLNDLERTYKLRFDDLKDNHARELRSKDSEAGMSKTQVEVTLNARIATLESEQKRLEAELSRVRKESDEHKRKAENWLEQMQQFREQAEAMGYVSPEDAGGGAEEGAMPKTFTEIAGAVAMKFAGNLPDTLDSLGKMLQSRGSAPAGATQQVQRARMLASAQGTVPQVMAGAAQLQARPAQGVLPFATEEGGYIPPPAQAPRPQPAPPPMVAAPPQPVAPPQQHSAPPTAATPPAQAIVPTSAGAPAPAEHEGPADGEANGIDSVINALASWYTNQMPAEQAAGLLLQNADDNARAALRGIEIDQIKAYLSVQQYQAAQVLQRREGEKYLRSVLAAIKEQLAAASAAT